MSRKPSVDAPCLEWNRVGGKIIPRWRARRSAIRAGYQPTTVYLDPAMSHEELAERCRALQAHMEAWLAAGNKRGAAVFDGTLGSLLEMYASDEDSPYRDLKYSTQQAYADDIKILRNAVGARRINMLTGQDFRRWYNNLRQPAKPGAPERLRRAHGVMTMLRIVLGYGHQLGLPNCGRLKDILSEMRFKTARARDAVITYQQAVAFIAKAHELGRPEMALGQALQFEGTLRQIDIIGEWVPDAMCRGGRWTNGLIWQDMLPDYVLRKPTTKTGRIAEIDFREYPLALAELERVPLERRIGPVIKDSRTGKPFRPGRYSRRWREIATVAGIPSNVWNRDSRAGGVTEGADAGATIEQMRRHASHASGSTTERYSRKTQESNRAVARLRVAHRGGMTEGGRDG